MSLQLNIPVADYMEFYGSTVEQMSLLVAEGRSPLSVSGLMKRRLEVLASGVPDEVKLAWWDNYVDTGDGAVRHSDGRLKIVPDAEYLRQFTPEKVLVNGAVPLSNDFYRGLEGEEFSPQQVERYFNKPLGSSDAKINPGWLALAGGDKSLLAGFVDSTFAQAKERFGYDGNLMGIYHSTVPSEGAAGRLWFVAGLGGSISSGGAVGVNHLGSDGGRFVGVAPEARAVTGGVAGPTLDQTVNVVLSAAGKYVAEVGRAGFGTDVRAALKPLYK
ncbi:hypothetical protein HYY72_01675 [Candidatus Woesearchaeota archaeon]|nr:hypothetical protein [Candidatus Woesearchaeota archaeon]